MDDCPMCRGKDEDLARMREDVVSLRAEVKTLGGADKAWQNAAARVIKLEEILVQAGTLCVRCKRNMDSPDYEGGCHGKALPPGFWDGWYCDDCQRSREAGIGEKSE